MAMMWPDLRDRYLRDIMTRFTSTNPAALITTFVSESLPANDSGFSAMPRQYSTLQSGLTEVRFTWDPRNRFSVENIWNNADYLATTEFQGQPTARHLVIVAASTPFDDAFTEPAAYNGGSTRWHQLALKLTQLRLQNSVEEPPSFPIDFNQVTCRLAARPQFYSVPVPQPNSTSQRVLPRRNHSFPLPSHTNIDDNVLGFTSSIEPENPPSLVSQLQQVHGLTKKKVYGAKPVHKPFVREERTRKGPPSVPPPLVLPSMTTSPRSSGSGKALSTSKAARISRLAQSSPTEMQGRRPSLPRRNSRMSSPETDTIPSPSSYMPSSVSATSATNMYIQPAPIVPSHHPETIIDPNWGSLQYKPLLSSLSQPALSQPRNGRYSAGPTRLLSGPWQDNEMDVSQPMVPSSVIVPSQSHVHYHSLSGSRRPSNGGSDTPSRRLPRRSSCPSDDEPFTFTAEYVAATAAMFKAEILPAYPDLQPAFSEILQPPRRAFYIAQDQSAPPSPSSPYDPGELYVTAEREEILQQSMKYSIPSAESPVLSYATSYSPGSSSSLTGWAG
ncbi:hypothetical protein C0991_007808 [Blastosporella zonata]|nr:hypothetical protein C0991_007808 [Blastosporella zonata]